MTDSGLGLVVLAIIAITVPSISFIVAYRAYRSYYRYLKMTHYERWRALMTRDPIVDSLGEWIRWPFGSVFLIRSAFTGETYGDARVKKYKDRIRLWSGIFLVSFGIAFATLLVLEKI